MINQYGREVGYYIQHCNCKSEVKAENAGEEAETRRPRHQIQHARRQQREPNLHTGVDKAPSTQARNYGASPSQAAQSHACPDAGPQFGTAPARFIQPFPPRTGAAIQAEIERRRPLRDSRNGIPRKPATSATVSDRYDQAIHATPPQQ
jgi:hypothetical protein